MSQLRGQRGLVLENRRELLPDLLLQRGLGYDVGGLAGLVGDFVKIIDAFLVGENVMLVSLDAGDEG